MFDLDRIVGVDWDVENAHKCVDQHGVGQAEAEQMFFRQPLIVAEDPRHSLGEPRFHALGRTAEGRLLQATFTVRDDGALLRVISARDMSRKERARYAQES